MLKKKADGRKAVMSKASFILPTRNVEGNIGPLLESIFFQEYDGDLEVLIMDSSDDRTSEIAKEFPVRIVRVEPEDYNNGKTRNEGVAMTDGDFLVFLSTDVEIRDRGWLSKLTRHFSDPEVAGIYGRQIPKDNATPMEQFFIPYTYPARSEVNMLQDGKLEKKLVLFSNANSAVRRSVWEQIKLPEMLRNEDIEWAKRALFAGYKIVYDVDATVYHSHNYSLKDAFQEYFDCGAGAPPLQRGRTLNYSMRNFVIDGLGFIFGEYKFMLKNGYWYWIPYAIIYDLLKFLGFFLGTKQKYMPLWLRKAFTKKKYHWDKYDDIIKEVA